MMSTSSNHALNDSLRAWRQRLDPTTFGFPVGRRRTPGLHRGEVMQLASINPTWYTRPEQGRGRAPSRKVLERITCGLRLAIPERERLFILTFGHPLQTRLMVTDDMTLWLQRVPSAFATLAIIRTASWDIITWNTTATRVLTDYSQLSLVERNVLCRLFTRPETHCTLKDWQTVGQLIISASRADVTRMGATTEIDQLIAEFA